MDKEYIRTQFRIIENNIDHYNQSGLARAMLRLAKVVDEKVFDEPEFNQKPKEVITEHKSLDGNLVQGTLRKTKDASKFIIFHIDSEYRKEVFSVRPRIDNTSIQVLQAMAIADKIILIEYLELN